MVASNTFTLNFLQICTFKFTLLQVSAFLIRSIRILWTIHKTQNFYFGLTVFVLCSLYISSNLVSVSKSGFGMIICSVLDLYPSRLNSISAEGNNYPAFRPSRNAMENKRIFHFKAMLFSYTFRDRNSNMRWILPWTDIVHIQHIYVKGYKPMMIRAESFLLNCADFIVNVYPDFSEIIIGFLVSVIVLKFKMNSAMFLLVASLESLWTE